MKSASTKVCAYAAKESSICICNLLFALVCREKYKSVSGRINKKTSLSLRGVWQNGCVSETLIALPLRFFSLKSLLLRSWRLEAGLLDLRREAARLDRT